MTQLCLCQEKIKDYIRPLYILITDEERNFNLKERYTEMINT
jgi:hypothetical protein